jgi:hypothetical protein
MSNDTHFDLDDTSIEASVADAQERMAEPSMHFNPGAQNVEGISTSASIQVESASISSNEKDNTGAAWNPEIHATGKDGGGVKTAKGLWRKRKQSRARTGTQESNAQAVPAQQVDASGKLILPPLTSQEIEMCKAVGAMIAEQEFVMFQSMFGSEWAPRREPDERFAMVSAWQALAIAKRWTDLSPGWMVLGAHCMYLGSRVLQPGPETKSRLSRIRENIGVIYVRIGERMRRARNKEKHTSEIGKDAEKTA